VAKHLCDILQIRHDLITPYHHEGTGLVERIHSYAETMLQAAMESSNTLSNWDETLPFIMFAIMTHTIDDSGITPFEIKHGLPATLPGDLLNNSALLPKNLREYYKVAQKAMKATRDYFTVQRRKRRIETRFRRNRLQRRYRKFFNINDYVYVTKPSFFQVAGVRGSRRIQGSHKGPYRVVGRDNHNNVMVEIEGQTQPFNVRDVEEAPVPDPITRNPPAYSNGLEYAPTNPQDTKSESPSKSVSTNNNTTEPTPNMTESPIFPAKENKNITDHVQKHSSGGRKRAYSVILDTALGQKYACELVQEDDTLKAHLYAKAKKGKYQPIWYNPLDLSDPPESKARLSKPGPDWKPWIVVVDESWPLIHSTQTSISKLRL
jgi:hypothetical protein